MALRGTVVPGGRRCEGGQHQPPQLCELRHGRRGAARVLLRARGEALGARLWWPTPVPADGLHSRSRGAREVMRGAGCAGQAGEWAAADVEGRRARQLLVIVGGVRRQAAAAAASKQLRAARRPRGLYKHAVQWAASRSVGAPCVVSPRRRRRWLSFRIVCAHSGCRFESPSRTWKTGAYTHKQLASRQQTWQGSRRRGRALGARRTGWTVQRGW